MELLVIFFFLSFVNKKLGFPGNKEISSAFISFPYGFKSGGLTSSMLTVATL